MKDQKLALSVDETASAGWHHMKDRVIRPRERHGLEDKKLALSVDETASALGVGRTSVWKLINQGKLRIVRIHRRVLVPRRALEEFLEGSAAE